MWRTSSAPSLWKSKGTKGSYYSQSEDNNMAFRKTRSEPREFDELDVIRKTTSDSYDLDDGDMEMVCKTRSEPREDHDETLAFGKAKSEPPVSSRRNALRRATLLAKVFGPQVLEGMSQRPAKRGRLPAIFRSSSAAETRDRDGEAVPRSSMRRAYFADDYDDTFLGSRDDPMPRSSSRHAYFADYDDASSAGRGDDVLRRSASRPSQSPSPAPPEVFALPTKRHDARRSSRKLEKLEKLEKESPEKSSSKSRNRSSPAAPGPTGKKDRRSDTSLEGVMIGEAWSAPSRHAPKDHEETLPISRMPTRTSISSSAGDSDSPVSAAGRGPQDGALLQSSLVSNDFPVSILDGAGLEAASNCEEAASVTILGKGARTGPAKPNTFSIEWKRGRRIGSGSYGCVYAARADETGEIFAVKESNILEDNGDDRKYREKLEYELAICKSLRHKNIVGYLGSDWVNNQLYIYLEYMAGGSMATVLSEFGALETKQLRRATRGLLKGLNYLHTREPPVVHRDVKAANILVNLAFEVKLADFGLSKRHQETRSLTMVGSVPWMAPEVILQKDGHGRKADIWSAGCTVIEMASAERPWGRGKFDNMMFALRHIGMTEATPPIPEDIPSDCQELIQSCVQRDPELRPSARELLRSKFVAKSEFASSTCRMAQ